jgi:O-6-methylguanine DNA methyltransferase
VVLAGDCTGLDYVGYPEATEDEAVTGLFQELAHPGQHDSRLLGFYETPIRDYFTGRPLQWSELPVNLCGTPFQVKVWQATRQIPCGETRTYGEIAIEAGCPRAARAAGSALAHNSCGLLVPCHRVVAVGGLGGYGPQTQRKLALLRLEGAAVVERSVVGRIAEPGRLKGRPSPRAPS